MTKNHNLDDLKNELKVNKLNYDILYFEEIDSTNIYAKENNINVDTLLIAGYQNKGSGRLNRDWVSEKNSNALISVIKKINIDNKIIQNINFYTSLITFFTLKEFYESTEFELKWPNDVLYSRKKIAGVLSEVLDIEKEIKRFIIGVGININQSEFDESITDTATSLKKISGNETDLFRFIARWVINFENYFELIFKGDRVLHIWKKNFGWMGKKVNFLDIYTGNQIEADIMDIEDSGALILKDSAGEIKKYHSGEIRMNIKNSILK